MLIVGSRWWVYGVHFIFQLLCMFQNFHSILVNTGRRGERIGGQYSKSVISLSLQIESPWTLSVQ